MDECIREKARKLIPFGCKLKWEIPFITENGRGKPRARKGRKGKRQGMPRCWLPSRETLWHPESSKDKAQGKCLICRRAGHGAKERPKRQQDPAAGAVGTLS